MTRRTYWLLEKTNDPAFINGYKADHKITCEVTGEMVDGTKVWTDPTTGEQYWCARLSGVYYFYQG